MGGRANRGAGLRLLALAGLAVLAGAGCARLFSHYDVAPNGLTRREDRLRQLLAFGHADSALARVLEGGDAAPDDALLRALYAGLLGHYAGAYDSSNAALQRAADLADDRYTKSISRSALSLISNDRMLPYEPGWTERLLIHYYAALNRLMQRDREGAAVEARRLAFLLEQEAERDPDERTQPLRALLRYFTGVVFEAAGEWNDAHVAYRNAWRLAGRDDAPPGPPIPGDSLGTAIVAVEQAFVAHRVEQSIVAPLHPVEVDWLTGSGGDERAAAAAEVAARIVAAALGDGLRPAWYDRRPPTLYVDMPPAAYFERFCAAGTADGDGGEAKNGKGREKADVCREDAKPYILRIAWPVYRQDREPVAGLRVAAGDGRAEPLDFRADVSRAVVRDFEEERTLLVARTLARAVSKLALTRGVEKSVGGEEEWVGSLLGLLTNVGTAMLEQADTRSWQLLPARIGIARLRLPPGTHTLTLQIPDGPDADARKLAIGTVDVRPGEVAVLSVRVWR